MVGAQRRIEQARYVMGRSVTQQRACMLMSVAGSGLVYTHRMPLKDASVISGMRKYPALYLRFGSRRVRFFLQRGGMTIGRDSAARIWAAAGLKVPAEKCSRDIVATGASRLWRRRRTMSRRMILCSTAVPMARDLVV
jgi:hypothetical protein